MRTTCVWFSGTGGTRKVKEAFEAELDKFGARVESIEIRKPEYRYPDPSHGLFLFFPVHAFGAPEMVEEYLKYMPTVKGKIAVVISVSGGGEVCPNTACRVRVKELLAAKGYRVRYERMFIMPANVFVQEEDALNSALIRIMPEKAAHAVMEIMAGDKRITKPFFADYTFSLLGRAEHIGARYFGRLLHADSGCIHCGCCVEGCPADNIREVNGRIVFGQDCAFCMRCITQCPVSAIAPVLLGDRVKAKNFSLEDTTHAKPDLDALKNNPLWKGVADYLTEISH